MPNHYIKAPVTAETLTDKTIRLEHDHALVAIGGRDMERDCLVALNYYGLSSSMEILLAKRRIAAAINARREGST